MFPTLLVDSLLSVEVAFFGQRPRYYLGKKCSSAFLPTSLDFWPSSHRIGIRYYCGVMIGLRISDPGMLDSTPPLLSPLPHPLFPSPSPPSTHPCCQLASPPTHTHITLPHPPPLIPQIFLPLSFSSFNPASRQTPPIPPGRPSPT